MKSKQSLKATMWSKHVESWQDAGLSQQAYCRMHGLNSNQFWYWKNKLQRAAVNQAPKSGIPRPDSPFLAVDVAQESIPAYPETEELTLVLPSGIKITGISSSNASVVRYLVAGYL